MVENIFIILLIFIIIFSCFYSKNSTSIESFKNYNYFTRIKEIKNLDKKNKLLLINKALSSVENDTRFIYYNNIIKRYMKNVYLTTCKLEETDDQRFNIEKCKKIPNSSDVFKQKFFEKISHGLDIVSKSNTTQIVIANRFIDELTNLLYLCDLIVEQILKSKYKCPCKLSGTVSKLKGCYIDKSKRDLNSYIGDMSKQKCADYAALLKKNYYGLQYQNGVGGGDNPIGQCFIGNRFGKYGKTSNCKRIGKDLWGQSWSNAVYQVSKSMGKCAPC
tara:strand:+ start:97 stop:921 length:825 start_codon:yes stop_codon:yes gene_type:complete